MQFSSNLSEDLNLLLFSGSFFVFILYFLFPTIFVRMLWFVCFPKKDVEPYTLKITAEKLSFHEFMKFPY